MSLFSKFKIIIMLFAIFSALSIKAFAGNAHLVGSNEAFYVNPQCSYWLESWGFNSHSKGIALHNDAACDLDKSINRAKVLDILLRNFKPASLSQLSNFRLGYVNYSEWQSRTADCKESHDSFSRIKINEKRVIPLLIKCNSFQDIVDVFASRNIHAEISGIEELSLGNKKGAARKSNDNQNKSDIRDIIGGIVYFNLN